MEAGPGSRWMVALTVLLLGLLAALAVLHVRWIDAWSASEAERMQRFMASGVERLAVDLDRVLVGPDQGLDFGPAVPEEDLPEVMRAQVEASFGPDVVADLRLDEQRVAPLVEEHLGAAFGDDVVVIVTRAGQIVYRSQPGLQLEDFSQVDAACRFGGGRLEIGGAEGERLISLEHGAEGGGVMRVELETVEVNDDGLESASPLLSVASNPNADLNAGNPPELIVVELPGWEVRARHAAGSIAAAVGAVRSRNMTLGLAVLGTLAAAVLLLVLAARRTRILARRQVEFVAGVTHELRTPLTVIRSAAENLRDCVVTKPEDMRRYGRLIDEEARRLTDFVERALSLAGTTPPPPAEHVELAPVIERCVDRFRSDSAHESAVRLELPPGLPSARVDPRGLEQALGNLLGNARKYGGAAQSVEVIVAARPGWVDITVRDEGPGISAAERKHVFEPFFRGQDARASQTPGAGLGLAVVQRLIDAQGGRVTLDSEPGVGSAFTLHLRVTGA